MEVGSSVEDLSGINFSFQESDYLDEGFPASRSPATTASERRTSEKENPDVGQQNNTEVSVIAPRPVQAPLISLAPPFPARSLPCYIQPIQEPHCNFVVTQLSPRLITGCIIDSDDSTGPAVGLSLTINLNGLLGSVETFRDQTGRDCETVLRTMDCEGEPDEDSFPILVRSMSTSRRHSWGVPVSPFSLGRR